MKKILILGKGSYIGESFYNWLGNYPENYNVQIISTMNYEWKDADWNNIDAVVNFAGIAHINNITEDMKELFYSINRDLAIEIGSFAKSYGVKQFIQFSSMNVYGDFCGVVKDRNAVNPSSFYGDSKLEGDLKLREMENQDFIVASVRPPFVYGKGCKGNYNTVRKLALKLPLFPTYKNKKSMIYIDNLCEFLRLVIDERVGGVLTPQNKELVSTSDLVYEISKVNSHVIIRVKMFNWAIPFLMKCIKAVKKAFIDDSYDLSNSDYFNWNYCVVNFEESIRKTEA